MHREPRRLLRIRLGAALAAVALVLPLALIAWGQTSEPNPDAVLDEMMQQLEQAPPIPPTQRPASADVLRASDPRILGFVPQHGPAPLLRPEGQLVVRRRASVRFLEDVDALPVLVFEADDEASPELPMFLMPSQITADLEAVGRKDYEGDLLVTGQIFVYRANYLLPMSFAIAPRKGNLQQ